MAETDYTVNLPEKRHFSIIFICIFHADVSPNTATIITELFKTDIFLTIQLPLDCVNNLQFSSA